MTVPQVFGQWMEVLRVITESDVPAYTLQVAKHSMRICTGGDWIS